MSASGSSGSSTAASPASPIAPGAAASRSFPPEVAMYVVKIACERPDELGRSLSQWDCTEIARQLVRDGVVESISAATVRRILLSHRLKPWRQKMWPSPKVPRDAAFAAQVREICDLYTRPLGPDEVVLCADEMTSLQPRPRTARTLPTAKDRPTRVEHEYSRCGALNLFAAFDTRTGRVERKGTQDEHTALFGVRGISNDPGRHPTPRPGPRRRHRHGRRPRRPRPHGR